MQDHPLTLIYAVFAAILTAVVAAIATRVQLLPEVIDLSLIPTGAGLGSLMLVGFGVLGASSPSESRDAPCSARWSVASRPLRPW